MGVGWFAFLVVGLFAGWIAERLMKRDHGLLRNLIVGVIGAYVGAFLFSLVGLGTASTFWGALVVAVIGAVVFLWITGKIFGR